MLNETKYCFTIKPQNAAAWYGAPNQSIFSTISYSLFDFLYAQLDFSHAQLDFLYGQLLTLHVVNSTFYMVKVILWSIPTNDL